MFDVAFSRRICCSRVEQRQHEAAAAVGVDGLAAQAARHLAEELFARGEEPDIGAAEGQGPLPSDWPSGDDDVGAHARPAV